ncbi:MAG: haloacid dehalogenase-like hydrolase [Rhodospirillales bacterium]|nr:haloacid dehalogenase-like hydrolase [Rhodospirillales bacterium]
MMRASGRLQRCAAVFVFLLLVLPTAGFARSDGVLPSWADGDARRVIVAFVEAVTEDGGPDFVPADDRIAVFDNDGTLWVEQPTYTQAAFALDRIKAMAPEHPDWRTTQPFQAVLENDRAALAAMSMGSAVKLVMASHAGMTTEAFATTVSDWIGAARHPRFQRPYTELAYQPMLELLAYLRDNGFKTFIVSGGGIAFMRPWAERVYGVPPEQVVGSAIKTRFEMRDGEPVLVRLPGIAFIDDKEGKPVGIETFIGRRPIAAFGNSDGDLQMLQWTTAGAGRRLGVLLRHDDAEREYAYDRESHVGRLDRALDEAETAGWVVVSMKDDWKTVFAEE